MPYREITITQIDVDCWEVKGEGVLILTDSAEKAENWKRIYEQKVD